MLYTHLNVRFVQFLNKLPITFHMHTVKCANFMEFIHGNMFLCATFSNTKGFEILTLYVPYIVKKRVQYLYPG